jgi:filamentous hemagglutinin family protein
VSTSINRDRRGAFRHLRQPGSNGSLVLVNPSGIAIGPKATANAGFTASTLA